MAMVRNSTPHGARDINVVLRMSILNMAWAFLKLVHSFLDHTPSIIVCWVYRCCQIVAWSHFRRKVPFFHEYSHRYEGVGRSTILVQHVKTLQ